MYSINTSNVPGVLPGVHLSTAVYSYSRSASLTSLLHLTMHSNRSELEFPGSNSFSLAASRPSKGSYSIAVRVVSTEDYIETTHIAI